MQLDSNKLVSVIVPMYNVERYITRCLKSILQQSYSNFEVICVNDGSSDNSVEICKEMAKKDDRIILVEKERNEGLAEARNTGLTYARGEYIMFVDSDDWIINNMIELLVFEREKSNADIVQCGFIKVRNDQLEIPLSSNIEEKIMTGREAILKIYETSDVHPNVAFTVVWDKLYNKNILDKISFTKGKLFEDQFFTYRCFNRSNKITVISPRLYCYRDNNSSITRSRYNIRFQDELDAHLEQIHFFRNCDEEIYHIILRKLVPLCINHFHRARHHEDVPAMKKAKNICKKVAMQYLKNPLVDEKDKKRMLLFLLSSETYYYFY